MATKKKADPEVVEAEDEAVPEDEGAGEDVAPADDAATDDAVDTAEVDAEADGADGAEDAEDADGDAVGPAVHSVISDSPIIPAPITPTTGPTAKHRRVLYENLVNGEAEAFAARARVTYTEVALAGGTVELVVTFPDEK